MGGEDGWCVVGGIAIGQVMGLQVEHADEGCDKNEGFIGGSDGMVHLSHDVGGTLVIACQIAEERAGDSHIERGGHTLACHVTDDEEEFVALNDEVVEVATHLFGRCHGGKEVEVVALWKDGGNHAHLYVVGDDKFTLQPLLAGGCGLQVFYVLLQ